MKWWYEPLKSHKHTVDTYEEVLTEIVNMCRFKMGKHEVPNYYIYNNEQGLVDIIKGSEIDPLSIARTSYGGLGYDIELKEVKNTFEEEYPRIQAIVNRTYKRSPEELIDIQEKLNIAQGDSIEEELAMSEGKVLLKEFNIKYDAGYNLVPYATRSFETGCIDYSDVYDCSNIPEFLKEEYDVEHLTEEHSFVFAIKGSKMLGVYPMSKGTDGNCDMSPRMIFKFLLLVGANSFIIAHNHPNGNSYMSQDDYEITCDIIKAAKFMDIEFVDHVIIGKDDYSLIKEDVIEMQNMNCTNVMDYYEIYSFDASGLEMN